MKMAVFETDREKAQFEAIIAKNQIARDIRDNPNHISLTNLIFQLKEIEKFTGEMNQPSVTDILDDESGDI